MYTKYIFKLLNPVFEAATNSSTVFLFPLFSIHSLSGNGTNLMLRG